MESSKTQVKMMKPILLKTGIPLAITLASFVFARILTRKSHASKPLPKSQLVNIDQECEKDDESVNITKQSHELQEEILKLRSRIQEIQDRELKLKTRFLRYQELKDRETEIMDLQNKLFLEINRVEFWEKEVSMLEEENQRFANMVVEYLKIMGMLQFSGLENKKLLKRIKKLLSRNKECCHNLKEQRLQIEAKEAEISQYQEEIEEKDVYIGKMEDEMREMKLIISEENKVKEITNFGGGIEEFVSDNETNNKTGGSEEQVHVDSRRRKLKAKFKKWIESSSIDQKTNHHKISNLDHEKEKLHRNYCFKKQGSEEIYFLQGSHVPVPDSNYSNGNC